MKTTEIVVPGPDALSRTSPVIRVKEILARTSLSHSCAYKQIALELFPAFIPLSDRARGQYEHVVDAWIGVRMDLRSQMSRLRDSVEFPLWIPEMALRDYPTGMRLLRLPEVEAQVGMKSSQIYRLIDLDRFPAPVPLTECAPRWLVHEIEEWLRGRVALSLKISGKRNLPRSRDDDCPRL